MSTTYLLLNTTMRSRCILDTKFLYILVRTCTYTTANVFTFFLFRQQEYFLWRKFILLNGGNVLLKHEDADSRIWSVRCDCVCRGFAPERREKDRRATQHRMFAEIRCVRLEDVGVYQVAVRCRGFNSKGKCHEMHELSDSRLDSKSCCETTLDPESYSASWSWQVQWRNLPIFVFFFRTRVCWPLPRCLDSNPKEPF